MPGFRSPEQRTIDDKQKKERSFTLIAECGSNHNGDLDRALNLIAHAAGAGATHVKFQLWRPDLWYSKRAMPQQYEKVAALAMPVDWLPHLADACRVAGVGFLCTAFDEFSLAVVDEYVECHKVASGDIDNIPLLRAIRKTGKPILLSTGASDIEDIEGAVITLAYNKPELDLTVLHCVSAYPTPIADANLSAIKYLKTLRHISITSSSSMNMKSVPRTDITIGYSDHTGDPYATWCAYSLGARVFEAHFDLVDGKGVEAGHSVTGDKLGYIRAGLVDLEKNVHQTFYTERQLVSPGWVSHFNRAVDIMVGEGSKHPMLCELPERDWARRGIYTTRPVKEGEPLKDAIRALRPACAVGGGEQPVSVSEWDKVVDGKADRDIDGDMPITRGDAI